MAGNGVYEESPHEDRAAFWQNPGAQAAVPASGTHQVLSFVTLNPAAWASQASQNQVPLQAQAPGHWS